MRPVFPAAFLPALSHLCGARRALVLSLVAGVCSFGGGLAPAQAQGTTAASSSGVVLSQAWVRPAAKGQRVTGGYLQIQAREAVSLVGVSTPVAGKAEVHEMKMEGDVMRMRALPSLPVGAGQTVSLQPGGNHLMLMDLKQPVAAGSQVSLSLKFKDAKGQAFEVPVSAVVQTVAPGQAPMKAGAGHGDHADHHGHHHH